MHKPDALRELAESYLGDLALTPELHGQAESVRYALTMGGKRVRPVICLATAEAAGAEPVHALPAAAAVELVHNFSLVHDDLPALDNDEVRRGNPSVWAQHGEAIAVLAGDALLAEAFRLALSYPTPAVGRELAQATLGMIGGQYLDIEIANGRARVALELVARYGEVLPELARHVQEEVTDALTTMCGVVVESVDVDVEEVE